MNSTERAKITDLAEQIAIICLKPDTAERAAAAYLAGNTAELGNIIADVITADYDLWNLVGKIVRASQPDPAAVGLAQMNAAVDKAFGNILGKLAPESRL